MLKTDQTHVQERVPENLPLLPTIHFADSQMHVEIEA